MIKVLIAIRLPGVDVLDIVQAHRRHLVETMHFYTRLKEDASDDDVGLLVADAEISGSTCSSAGWTPRKHGSSAYPRKSTDPRRRHGRGCADGLEYGDDGAPGAAAGVEVLWRGAPRWCRPCGKRRPDVQVSWSR